METIEDVVKGAEAFRKEWIGKGDRGRNHRFRSWEYCYKAFGMAFVGKKKPSPKDIDALALQLAFYLASWGMYRGSSFLLQRDYKVHIPAVMIVLKHGELRGISFEDLKDEVVEKVYSVATKLCQHYEDIRKSCNEAKDVEANISSILVTKVLLGTLGCVPAYDTYLKRALKGLGITQRFGVKSMGELVNFWNENKKAFKSPQERIDKGVGFRVPEMKVLDMGLWKVGEKLVKSDKTKKRRLK